MFNKPLQQKYGRQRQLNYRFTSTVKTHEQEPPFSGVSLNRFLFKWQLTQFQAIQVLKQVLISVKKKHKQTNKQNKMVISLFFSHPLPPSTTSTTTLKNSTIDIAYFSQLPSLNCNKNFEGDRETASKIKRGILFILFTSHCTSDCIMC